MHFVNVSRMQQGMHVLIADDESDFLFSASIALRGAGYRVTVARSGREAFARILEARAKGDPVRVLVTDQQMPGMIGTELADCLRERGFEMPMVIVTAFRDVSMDAHVRPGSFNELMEKPIEPEALVSCLKRVAAATS
jgi:CheY-like chemotaxis protein